MVMQELLTINELAAKLKVSPWTIRAWCSKKFIPYFKLRGCVRFQEREIDLWLKKNISHGRSVYRLRIEAAMGSKNGGIQADNS